MIVRYIDCNVSCQFECFIYEERFLLTRSKAFDFEADLRRGKENIKK
jgi:hypothetical protein